MTPEVVIISVGADNNSYGHSHQEALDRIDAAAGVQHVLRTDIDGTIIILTTTGDGNYTIETMGSSKTVVVPELETAFFVACISLISMVVYMNRDSIWKSLRPA